MTTTPAPTSHTNPSYSTATSAMPGATTCTTPHIPTHTVPPTHATTAPVTPVQPTTDINPDFSNASQAPLRHASPLGRARTGPQPPRFHLQLAVVEINALCSSGEIGTMTEPRYQQWEQHLSDAMQVALGARRLTSLSAIDLSDWSGGAWARMRAMRARAQAGPGPRGPSVAQPQQQPQQQQGPGPQPPPQFAPYQAPQAPPYIPCAQQYPNAENYNFGRENAQNANPVCLLATWAHFLQKTVFQKTKKFSKTEQFSTQV